MCRSSVGIDFATVLDRVTLIGEVEVGAPGSRCTRILLGAAPAYCSSPSGATPAYWGTLTITSFSAASIAFQLSLKLENPDEMNLVLLTVQPPRLLAQMLILSQRGICSEILRTSL